MQIQNILLYLITINICFALVSCAQESKEEPLTKDNLAMDVSFDKDKSTAYVFTGTKTQVEKGKSSFEYFQKRVDPALDIVLNAGDLSRNGKYDKAETEARRALAQSKTRVVDMLAHSRLLRIYEATKKYPQAIEEINWLLEHVNQYAKPALIEKKKQLQKIVEEKK
jgi:tetratricopeptide (TPR) repeat protein